MNAVQTFNNPLTTFKTEAFIVMMTIGWTYPMHAHYRGKGVEYRYYTQVKQRCRFDRTKSGTFKFWELERCLSEQSCPLDGPTKANLRFLIGLRHEIEHHMSAGVDDYLGGRYLACCLNYETWITNLFGTDHSLDRSFGMTLQFRDLMANPQPDGASAALPSNIAKYIHEFDSDLSGDVFQSEQFSFRILFTRKIAKRLGQADRAIEFVPPDFALAEAIDRQYWVLKETERKKFGAKQIVKMMQDEGYPRFTQHSHTQLWRRLDAQNPEKGYGAAVLGQWAWYEHWIDRVRKECADNSALYGPISSLGLGE